MEKNKAIEKISDLIQNHSEAEFVEHMFPKVSSFEVFKQLIKHEEEKRDEFFKYESVKRKTKIITNFFERLENEKIYDLKFDKLDSDRFTTTKKIDRGNNILDNLQKIWDKKINDSDVETICQAYASCYERFCKRYLQPLASKIKKKNISKCGVAIDVISTYEKDTERIIKSCVIPQIRNSINHMDYYYDAKTNLIHFDDNNKPTMKISPQDVKILIHLMMENETCFSLADFQVKETLLKTIISESEDCMRQCQILGINFDELMSAYLRDGHSLFEVNWKLKQIIENIRRNSM